MKKSNIKSFILLACMFIPATLLYAVPAYPYPITYTQPNGDTLTIRIKGDEKIHWHESLDEFTLFLNQEGYLTYAQLDENGNLQASAYIATDIEKRDIATVLFLNTIKKKLFFSEVQIQVMLQVWEMEEEFAQQNETKGSNGIFGHYKGMCALVNFPDKTLKFGPEDFDRLMNEIGYTNGNVKGSVRDYFKEISYGNFEMSFTMFGPYTAQSAITYYAGESGSDRVKALATEIALKIFQEPGINFANFDANNDKEVDCFHFIFPGVGKETNSNLKTIWSHKGNLSTPVSKDGKTISKYSCSPELKSANTIISIGVMCHEMTHNYGGVPDYYDDDYAGSGGEYPGTGDWDLMASGCYNGNSNTPSHPNMYIKVQFGWVTPIVLNEAGSVSTMPNAAEKPVAFRINTNTPTEYYLLENRQKVGFDSQIPGSGLLIYHVSYTGQGCTNCKHPQKMYPVVASRTTQMPNTDPKSYGSVNKQGCLFPHTYTNAGVTTTKDSFEDDTTPAMWTWNNASVGKPITNIKKNESNKTISFDFMGGGDEVGIHENVKNESTLQVIPNPAHEYFELRITNYELQINQIDIYNAFGQLVKSVPYHGEITNGFASQRISIADLNKGFYFVSVGNAAAKLVVQ